MILNCLANLVLLSVALHALAVPVAGGDLHLADSSSTGGLGLRPRCIGSWWCFGRNSNTPPPQPPRFSDLTVINEEDVPYRGNSAETTRVPNNTYPPQSQPVVPFNNNAAAGGSQSASITGTPGGSAHLGQGGVPSIAGVAQQGAFSTQAGPSIRNRGLHSAKSLSGQPNSRALLSAKGPVKKLPPKIPQKTPSPVWKQLKGAKVLGAKSPVNRIVKSPLQQKAASGVKVGGLGAKSGARKSTQSLGKVKKSSPKGGTPGALTRVNKGGKRV